MRPARAAAIVAAIWLAGLGAAAQFGKASILYDELMARYGEVAGPAGVGLVVSIVGLVGLVFGTIAGIAVGRAGLSRTLVAALWLAAGIAALQVTLPPYPWMILLRVVEGMSHLAIVVAGPTLIAAITPQRLIGAAMTLWSSFFGVSYTLLALLAPPVVTAFGAKGLILGHAAWFAIFALVLGVLLRGVAPPLHAASGQGGLWARHVAIYRSPRISAPALGFVFYTILYVALLTLVPPLLPDTMSRMAAVAMPALSILVSLTLGVWLLDRIGPVRLVQAGFALALCAAPALAFPEPAPGLALAGALVVSAGLGLVQGASFATIPALNPDPADRTLAAGAIAQMGNVGTVLGTPVLAALIAVFGPVALAGFALPICAAGIAVHSWQARRRARGEDAPIFGR